MERFIIYNDWMERLWLYFVFSATAVHNHGVPDREGYGEVPLPCPDDYNQFCEHGQCEMTQNLPTCR